MARKDPATKKAIAKYQKEKCKNKTLQFTPIDMHLCKHAESTGNFSGYVKDLIRADMKATAIEKERAMRSKESRNIQFAIAAVKEYFGNRQSGDAGAVLDLREEEVMTLNALSREEYMAHVEHMGLSKLTKADYQEWYEDFAATDWVAVWRELREDFAPETRYYARSYLTWERQIGSRWETCESDSPYYDEDFDTLEEAKAAYDAIIMDEQIDAVQKSKVESGVIRNVRFVRELGSSNDDTWEVDVIEREEVDQG